MANYIGITKTNEFVITDIKRFTELTNGLSAEDNIEFYTKNIGDNKYKCSFGCYDELSYYKQPTDILDSTKAYYDEEKQPIKWNDINEHTYIYDEQGSIVYNRDDCDDGMDYFITELSKILDNDTYFEMREIGHEKLRCVDAGAYVARKNKWNYVCFDDLQDFDKIFNL